MNLTHLITGGTDGIGKETVKQLLQRGDHVILHGRTEEKAKLAKLEVLKEYPKGVIETVFGDLASLQEVKKLAEQFLSLKPKLTSAIFNAGVYMKEKKLSIDGFELTLAINHLSHFLLTQKLLPLFRENHTRVVVVSSVAHGRGRLDFSNLNAEKTFDAYGTYALSKLANVLFAVELAEREKGHFTVNSLHPGVISTKLLRVGFGMAGAPLSTGAETSVFLALDPSVEKVTGEYFSNSTLSPMHPVVQDTKQRKAFWEQSEKWLAAKGF